MWMRSAAIIGSAVISVITAAPWSSASDVQPAPVTDAAVLELFGYPAGARNVSAFTDRLNQPLSAGGEPTDYYGSSASGFSSYVGQSFKPPMADPTAPARIWDTVHHAGDVYFVAGDPNFQGRVCQVVEKQRRIIRARDYAAS